MSVTVQLRCGTRGPHYDLWKKRLALYLSLLRLRMREQDALLLIEERDGGPADISQRADLLDWLVAQREVVEVTCERHLHAWDGPNFSISVRAAGAGQPAAAA